jgi:hypothetical protein
MFEWSAYLLAAVDRMATAITPWLLGLIVLGKVRGLIWTVTLTVSAVAANSSSAKALR